MNSQPIWQTAVGVAYVFWLLRLLLVISLCELQFKLLLLSHHVHRTACYAWRCRSSWRKTSYIRWLTVRTIRRRLKSRRRERFRCTVYCSLLLKVKSHDWSQHSLFYATFLQIAIFELFINVFWLTLICLLRPCRSLYIGFLLVQFYIQFVFIHAVYKNSVMKINDNALRQVTKSPSWQCWGCVLLCNIFSV